MYEFLSLKILLGTHFSMSRRLFRKIDLILQMGFGSCCPDVSLLVVLSMEALVLRLVKFSVNYKQPVEVAKALLTLTNC